jgi:hypothetical protein
VETVADRNTYRGTIQSEKILGLLRSAHGAWVPLPEILALSIAQYSARIFELRRRGFNIQNRTETVDGVRRSWFRLADSAPPPEVPKPNPPKEIPWADRKPVVGLPLWDAVRQ